MSTAMTSRPTILSPGEQPLTIPSPPITPSSSPKPAAQSIRSAYPTPPSHEISFYSNGDLLLEVPSPSGPTHLRVASAALCIASPVFRAMLAPGRFSEGVSLSNSVASGQDFTLSLPDDDLDSLVILCNILHFNHHKVPRHISVDALAKLCVLLDKYVCCLAAASWIDFWFAHMPMTMSPIHVSGSGTNEELCATLQWVYISSVVGDCSRFKYYSGIYVLNMPADVEIMDPVQREWFERLSETIQDALIDASHSLLSSTTGLVNDFVSGNMITCQMDTLHPPSTASLHSTSASTRFTSRQCDAHFTGALMQALAQAKIEPSLYAVLADPAAAWKGNVQQLFEKMEVAARGVAQSRLSVAPHSHCAQGKVLLGRLRELRVGVNTSAGLDLKNYKGRGNRGKLQE